MRKITVLTGVLAFFLACSIASASILDAPHNETNNISCGDCHAYSLWWQYSPAANSTAPNYSTIADAVCSKCHSQVGYPNKIGHSFSSMAEMHNPATGNWSTKCVDCHDPHHQRQLDWLATNPSLASEIYLVSGTIDLITNTSATETTFSYSGVTTKPGWENPADWANKSIPGRGLMLLVDGNTYEVNAASAGNAGAGSITIQGIIDTSTETLPFELIYGQLIKSVISTPNPITPAETDRSVQFFDPKGSVGKFVDQVNTPPEGICQVCHTLTDYWHADGTLAIHNTDKVCTSCHDTSLGFKPINADHTTHVGAGPNDGTCITCHTGADVILDIHKGKCEYCHTNPPNLKWAPPNPAGINYCTDCHDSDGPGLYDEAGNFKNHPKALDHTGQVIAAPQCTTACHFHNNKDLITQIHDPNNTGDPCNHCHDIANGGILRPLAAAGPGDCTNCHTDIAAYIPNHPNANTHAGQVTSTPDCVRCHKLDVPNPTSTDPIIGNVHGNNCGDCHDGNWALKSLAATNGPGDCVHCHGDFYLHTTAVALNPALHDTRVANEAACSVCHNQADPVADIHFNNCDDCHDALGNLINGANGNGDATGHGVADAGFGNPNVCTTCHTDPKWASTTTHPDHSAIGTDKILPEASCVSCHTGDLIEVVHNKGGEYCLICHLSLKPTEIHTLIGSAAGNNQGGNCEVCHTPVPPATGYFYSHKKSESYKHTGQVLSTGTNCTTCHLGTPILQIHNMACSNCHSADGELQGSAAGKGTGKPPTTGLNCVDCHSNGFDSLHTTSGNVDLSHATQVTAMTPQSCTTAGCHDEVSSLGAGIYVGSNSAHTKSKYIGTDSCLACHDSVDGALKLPAIPLGGDCKSCHTSTLYDAYPHS